MKNRTLKATAGTFAAVIISAGVALPPASAATPTGAVPFAQANFSGYATGSELHLGSTLLNTLSQATGLNLNNLDQGFSSASTATAGLTTSLKSELGSLLQPAQPSSVKAFDQGAGLNLDLAGAAGQTLNSVASTLLTSVKQLIPNAVSEIAPPDLPAVTDSLGPLNLDPVLDASAFGGQALAAWPGTSCPTGNLSYGLGELTAENILTGLPALTSSGISSAPLISTAGTNNATAVSQSKSLTTLVPNGDGSYGVQTQSSDIIAPITVNLLGLATLSIAVHSAGGVDDPVTLTATTSGEPGVPASLKMSTDDLLTIQLTPLGQSPLTLANVPLSSIGANGLHIPITLTGLTEALSQISVPNALVSTLQNIVSSLPSSLQQPVGQVISALSPVLNQVTDVVGTIQSTLVNQPTVQQLLGLLNGVLNLNLGSIDVDTVPHAIGAAASPASTVGGTEAGGALDLLNVNLGLQNSSIDIGGQTIPAGTIPGITQAISIPAITNLALPNIPLANPVVGHLEAQASQSQPIACATAADTAPTTTPTTLAARLPFTGGPGGLWQPLAGLAVLGAGGGSLALVRRLRRREG